MCSEVDIYEGRVHHLCQNQEVEIVLGFWRLCSPCVFDLKFSICAPHPPHGVQQGDAHIEADLQLRAPGIHRHYNLPNILHSQ